MPYIVNNDFRVGVDRRRSRIAGTPGSLWECINAHITRGGEIEKRKKFVIHDELPPGTFGLKVVNSVRYVWGSEPAPAGLPTGVVYQRLIHPDGGTEMVRLMDVTMFNGKFYAIARYQDGTIHHFYDGVHVSGWGAGGTNPSQKGILAVTHRSKVYSPVGELAYFSAIDNAMIWDSADNSAPGAGVINLATREEGSLDVVGIGKYQGNLAFFSDNTVQIWQLDEDPLKNILVETMDNTGTVAGGSVQKYGNNDTFYLARSGLRSLRARDSSNSAFVSDVGNAIDTILIADMQALGEIMTSLARATIEPVDGRYWLTLGGRIYVLSHFPGAKITGWSWYEPGFVVDHISIDHGNVYVRAEDTIYLYGGVGGDAYDTTPADAYVVKVGLPFMATTRIAEDKIVVAYDVAVTNEWTVEMLVDPRDERRKVVLGQVEETTYPDQIYPVDGNTTHFAPVLTCKTPGPATIANFALHLEEQELETVV